MYLLAVMSMNSSLMGVALGERSLSPMAVHFAVMLFAVATGRTFPLVRFPFPDFRFRERVFNMSISLRGEAQ